MQKKVVSILSILMAMAFLAACGAQPSTSQIPSTVQSTLSEPSNDTASEPASGETVTIEMWHNLDEAIGQTAVLDTLIAQFEQEHQDIHVEHLFFEWETLRSNVVTGASTGMLPDVLLGDTAFVPQFQSLDVLLEMGAFPDYAETAAQLLEAPNSSAIMNDKFYGIASTANTKILFYNAEMLAAAGADVPTTLDELWDVAATLSGDGKYGMVEPGTLFWCLGQYIWSNGGDILAPDYSTAQGYVNSDIAVETIEKLVGLYQAGSLACPMVDPGLIGDTDGLNTGIYGMVVDGPWREALSAGTGNELTAAPLPAGTAGSVGILGGANYMMFETSDDAHQKASWEFIKFMSGKDAQVAFAKVGTMPINKEAIEDPETLAAMPLLPLMAEALENARTRPVHPRWSEMEDVFTTKVAEAFMEQKTVQQALDEAAEEIDKLLV